MRLRVHDGPWCALVKLDTTTKWWRELMLGCGGWAPFRRRVAFERPDKPPLTANFASALVWRRWTPGTELASWIWLESPERNGAA
jgi:hypothetical protein